MNWMDLLSSFYVFKMCSKYVNSSLISFSLNSIPFAKSKTKYVLPFKMCAFKMGIKKNWKVRNYQQCNWVQSEYTKSLQMLFPIYAVFHVLSKNFEAPEVR